MRFDEIDESFDKKRSYAWRMDGGANDEGWGNYDSVQANKPQMTGMYFFDIDGSNQEEVNHAAIYGIYKLKSGKFAKKMYDKSGRSASFQLTQANNWMDELGRPHGKWWEMKK